MDGEQKFWVFIWFTIGSLLVTALIAGLLYWHGHNKLIVDMIKSGVDPVAAMCALQDDYGAHPTCVILATQKGMQ